MQPPPTPRTPPVIGRYRVLRLLGQGAMGRVLLAEDTVLGREVAVKILRDDLGLPPEMRDALFDRMKNEAKAAARVAHPNLVTLHDMGEEATLGVYLVFELVHGPTLRERIDVAPLAPREVARLARELGGALSTAHAAGVLHRDVKPDNVLLSPHGAKITDFGIARIPDSTLTRAGSLIGTPAYAAPEALGRSEFSAASDVFSLGATLYEALSGDRAFPGDDALAVSARIANAEPPPFARRLGLDPQVDAIFARALAKEPAARYPSPAALGEALAAALDPPAEALRTLAGVEARALPASSAAGSRATLAIAAALVGCIGGAAATSLALAVGLPPEAASVAAPASASVPAPARSARAAPSARPRPRASSAPTVSASAAPAASAEPSPSADPAE